MPLLPEAKNTDISVKKNFRKISKELGYTGSPRFIGQTLTGLTKGSVLFAGASGVVSQDNDKLFWDNTNKRLGIGTDNPQEALDLSTGNFITTGTIKSGHIGIGQSPSGSDELVIRNDSGIARIRIQSNVTSNIDVRTFSNTQTVSTQWISRKIRGTASSPSVIEDNDRVGSFAFLGHDGTDFNTSGASLIINVDGSVASNSVPMEFAFELLKEGETSRTIRIIIRNSGFIGFSEPDPETLAEWTHAQPYLTLHNSTHEDTDGGRESRLNFKGEQSGGEETTLARIEVGHDGTANDQKGYLDIFINSGSDGDSPTKQVRIDSTGLTLTGNIVMPDGGTIGQAAGPLLTFDDTNNFLEITGCKVGIGTTGPGASLDIQNSAGTIALNIYSAVGVDGSYGVIIKKNSTSAAKTILELQNANGAVFTVLANGKAGIGMTPDYTLDVNGNIRTNLNIFCIRDHDGVLAPLSLSNPNEGTSAGCVLGMNAFGTNFNISVFGDNHATKANTIEIGSTAGAVALHLLTEGIPRLSVMSDGKVGINVVPQAKFDLAGDMLFSGASSGLPFGEISVVSNATETAIATQNVYVQITTFNTNGESLNVTPDHTNDHLTITKAGRYFISCSITLNSVGGAGSTAEMEVKKNNGATRVGSLHVDRTLSGGGTESGAITITGIANLAVDDTIEVWIKNETNTQNYVVEDITLTIFQKGG